MPDVRQPKPWVSIIAVMKKQLIAIIIAFICASNIAFAQDSGASQATKCQLSAAQLPAIRGLRVGMSLSQILSLFPGSSDDPVIKEALARVDRAPNYGLLTLNLSPSKYSSPPLFSGVSEVGIDSFDGRVYRFTIRYAGIANKYPWSDIDQFLEKVINNYKLPDIEMWGLSSEEEGKVLGCEQVTVRASIEGGCCPVLEVRTPQPIEQVRARHEAEMKKLRDTFMP